MKSSESMCNHMNSNEFKQIQVKSIITWNHIRSSEITWNPVRSNEFNWNPLLPNQFTWNQVKPNETKDQVKSNEIKGHRVKSSEPRHENGLNHAWEESHDWHVLHELSTDERYVSFEGKLEHKYIHWTWVVRDVSGASPALSYFEISLIVLT